MTDTLPQIETEAGAAPAPLTGVDRRAVELTFDFSRAILDHPELLDTIPDGATLILIPPDDAELAALELKRGIAAVHQGRDIYVRHLRPTDRVTSNGEGDLDDPGG